jgi:hypothetical protein
VTDADQDAAHFVHDDRDQEPEDTDAAGNLLDLPRRVNSRITWRNRQFGRRAMDDSDPRKLVA